MARRKSTQQLVGIENSVAARRRAMKLTQTALAELVGCDQTTISSFENRATWPSWDILSKIAEELGCTSVLELFVKPDQDPDLLAILPALTTEGRAILFDTAKSMASRRKR